MHNISIEIILCLLPRRPLPFLRKKKLVSPNRFLLCVLISELDSHRAACSQILVWWVYVHLKVFLRRVDVVGLWTGGM